LPQVALRKESYYPLALRKKIYIRQKNTFPLLEKYFPNHGIYFPNFGIHFPNHGIYFPKFGKYKCSRRKKIFSIRM
jgi:hypothetical protein